MMPRSMPCTAAPAALARAALLGLAAGGCAGAVPSEPPPLAALERPFALLAEPDDEAARAALEPGAFSGASVADARRSLDELAGTPEGVAVARVVENSPAVAAGLQVGDLLLEARWSGPGGAREVRALTWPADWRAVELDAPPGTEVALLLDRAGVELERSLVLAPRLRPAERVAAETFVEDRRVGVVVRTATEVEARAAGLPPGGGAVVVGLARESPWRGAGLRFEDLVVAVDGTPVAHPLALLETVRAAPAGARLRLRVARPLADGGSEELELDAPLSRRARETKELRIPLLLTHQKDGERATTSALLGAVRWERTPAAWSLRLLWLLAFGRGDADRLEEVEG